MPDYNKRALWLRGVARHLEDQALAALVNNQADRMIVRARAERLRISAYTHVETMPAGLMETA